MDKADKKFLERVRFKTAKAVEDYHLIHPGDKILVAVSGGKDSMVLLDSLHNRTKYFGFDYELIAVNIELTDVGYEIEKHKIEKFCKDRNIAFIHIKDHTKIVDGNKHPCFYCAWNRRKLLFEFAVKHRYNKVAFGHNRDDVVETLLMNMIYHSEMSAFPVKLKMFGGKLEIIRPLIYVSNAEAKRYTDLIGYEPVPYNCPFAKGNDREKFRDLLKKLYEIHPHATENIFKSLHNIKAGYLPRKFK
jgi:tRNA(Ile)-lysidine synthase TilS/MesJ